MLNTYCDNNALKMHIACNRPSSDGLFLHELSMISYAEIGQVNANNPSFSSVFSDLDVKYPILLLFSLVERGYINIQKSVNNLSFYRTAKLQEFAKKRGLKHPNNREKMVDIIKQACTEEEIDDELSLSFYLPTEKGYAALKNSRFSLYPGMQDEEPLFIGEPVNENEIIVHDAIPEGIEVITKEPNIWKYYLVVDGIKMPFFSTIWILPKRLSLYVKINDSRVFSINDIDAVTFCYEQKKLIFRTLSNPDNRVMTPANLTCFDLVNCRIQYKLFDSGSSGILIDTFDLFVSKKCVENFGVIKDNQVFYYVSLKNRIIELIVSSIITCGFEQVKVVPIGNYSDDQTLNAIVIINKQDQKSRNLVQYMIKERLLGEVSIFNLPIREIAYCLYCQNVIENTTCITTQEQYREDLLRHRDCVNLLEKMEETDNGHYLLNNYIWKFPRQIFRFEPFRNYTCNNDYNWMYANQHESELQKEFKNFVLQLKENGTIPTRWVSELNLFFAIKAVFPDSIYQFRAEWLQLQSLDIFIPSKKTAIEYQGIQHYKPVEIFGGEEGLEKTQERDRRKASLCKEIGVQLLEWNYQVNVSEKNVKNFLQSHNLIK